MTRSLHFWFALLVVLATGQQTLCGSCGDWLAHPQSKRLAQAEPMSPATLATFEQPGDGLVVGTPTGLERLLHATRITGPAGPPPCGGPHCGQAPRSPQSTPVPMPLPSPRGEYAHPSAIITALVGDMATWIGVASPFSFEADFSDRLDRPPESARS